MIEPLLIVLTFVNRGVDVFGFRPFSCAASKPLAISTANCRLRTHGEVLQGHCATIQRSVGCCLGFLLDSVAHGTIFRVGQV
jgi:hypothetical protein